MAATTTMAAAAAGASAPTAGGLLGLPGPIRIDTQHEDFVHDAQMDYYGAKLATCSSDRTVKVYRVSDSGSELVATLLGHEGPVWQVAWAHPKFGVVLASCGFDGSVLIHQESHHQHAQQQQQAARLPSRGGASGAGPAAASSSSSWSILHAARGLHESSVNSVAFAPHEYGALWLAAASSDGRVSFLRYEPAGGWSASYLPEPACQLGVNAVSWAPFGSYYGAGGSSGEDGDGGAAEEEESAADPGSLEAPRIVTGGCDGAVRFWVCRSAGGAAAAWEPDPSPVSSALVHSDWVRDVAWAPNLLPYHNTVASASEDGTVLVWRQTPESGGEWRASLLRKFPDPVWRVSWSVTGHLLAVSSGDSSVTLWKEGLDGTWSEVGTVDDADPQAS